MVQPPGENPFTNYANDTDLLIEWALGIGTIQYFDQQSPLTQSLMNDPHQKNVIAQIQRDLAEGKYQDEDNYSDPRTPGQVLRDFEGFLTKGVLGAILPTRSWAVTKRIGRQSRVARKKRASAAGRLSPRLLK